MLRDIQSKISVTGQVYSHLFISAIVIAHMTAVFIKKENASATTNNKSEINGNKILILMPVI